jgi:hypothetical protein
VIAAAAGALAVGAEPHASRLLVRRGGAIVAIAPNGARRTLLEHARDAAYSPDGTLVAFVRAGDLWTANADGSGQRRLAATPNATESRPAWLPGGRGLVYQAVVGGRRQIRVFALPTGPSRRIAGRAGTQEWSPAVSRGGRLAFVSDRSGAPRVYVANSDGTGAALFHPAPPPPEAPPPTTAPTETSPTETAPTETAPAPQPAPQPAPPADLRDLAWSPGGTRLAETEVAADGTSTVVVDDGTTATPLPRAARSPVWAPRGRRIAFAGPNGTLHTAAPDGRARRALGAGRPLDWQDVPTGRVLYPNLVQRPPSGLLVTQSGGHWLLGFTSLVDNRGPGVLWLRGTRPGRSKVMQARQLLRVAGGRTRVVEQAGEFRFTVAWPHFHWHYLAFDRYELRRVGDPRVVVRDHKEGFCLADHYGIAQGVPHGAPRFLGSCERFDPGARYVEEGSSVGYTDRYPGFYEGQSLDLTGLPAGTYWLEHRVNSDFHLRELRYGDDTASLLLRLSWPGGRGAEPRVTTLRTCRRERC